LLKALPATVAAITSKSSRSALSACCLRRTPIVASDPDKDYGYSPAARKKYRKGETDTAR
jgi:hypothetical protein